MIRSMTGYGEASVEASGTQFQAELRSVNHRYFKCSVRAPEELSGLEPELETLLRKRVARGSFALLIRVRGGQDSGVSQVNDDALLAYLDHLETIHGRLAARTNDPSVRIDLAQLLALPGVLTPGTDPAELLARGRTAAPQLVEQAVAALDTMRRAEGQALAGEFERLLERMTESAAVVAERAPQVVIEHRDRLLARVKDLTASAQIDIDHKDLTREAAIFADRSDVTEELHRLDAHVQHFREALGRDNGEPVGRTLDFLAQEMLREANTIGSKANDGEIAQRVVELKTAIDRIKEQVQNVE
ncbi:MAG: YicC/YloC family endoribonuclease [Planctomycetota bacterium]